MATTKKETETKGFDFDAFNKGKPMATKENTGFQNEEFTLEIKEIVADKSSYEGEEAFYFDIKLKEQNNEFLTNARQYFKLNEDGSLKSFIYPEWVAKDGKKIPASVMWEIIHLLKEFSAEQEKDYESKKAKLIEQFGADNWFSPNLFKGMKFRLAVAEVVSNKDGKTYFIPQFSKQRLQQEERKNASTKEIGDNSAVVDKVMSEDSFNPDDLPF